MFLEVLLFIKQVHQKSVLFPNIDIFLDKGFEFQPSVYN